MTFREHRLGPVFVTELSRIDRRTYLAYRIRHRPIRIDLYTFEEGTRLIRLNCIEQTRPD